MISLPLSILFDKGVVRRVYEAQYRRGQGRLPTFLQMQAVAAFAQLRAPERQLYISPESANVLQLRRPQYANTVLANTAVLRKGRYLSRWARRYATTRFLVKTLLSWLTEVSELISTHVLLALTLL